MNISFRIARLFGIPVQVHWTFILVIAWIFYLQYSQGWDWSTTLWWTGMVIALFTCVVMHEFGHALTARRFGVNTRDIILSPIGGIARLDKLPEKPVQEFLVAIAGPLVNISLVILLLPYLWWVGEDVRTQLFALVLDPEGNFFQDQVQPLDYFVFILLLINLTLAVFNLLPAFPMDGGRILRSLLSIRMTRVRATQIAAYIGQGFAIILLVASFFSGNLFQAFIAIFIFSTALNEYRMVKFEDRLEAHKVGDVFRSTFTRFQPNCRIEQVLEVYKLGVEKNFLIFHEGTDQLAGLLPEQRIIDAYKKKDFGAPVAAYQRLDFKVLHRDQSLKYAYDLFGEPASSVLPVVDRGEVIGLLDVPILNRFFQQNYKGGRRQKTAVPS